MTNKVMTWVLIMALLISQSYAYASVPCESNARGEHNHTMGSNSLDPQSLASQRLDPMTHGSLEHDMTNHMQHAAQQQAFSMDCCDDECSCPSGTSSSATLTHFMTFSALRLVSDPSGFHLLLLQETFLPSLRKPPIIS